MKIKELIKELNKYDPDMDVGFKYINYGDPLRIDLLEMSKGYFWGETAKNERNILWINK